MATLPCVAASSSSRAIRACASSSPPPSSSARRIWPSQPRSRLALPPTRHLHLPTAPAQSAHAPSARRLSPTLRQLLQSFAPPPDHPASQAHPQVEDGLLADFKTPTTHTITATVRSIRTHAKVSFLALNDGSLPGDGSLQAVLAGSVRDQLQADARLTVGAAVKLKGQMQPSKGKGQKHEFKVAEAEVVAACEVQTHPLLAQPESKLGPDLIRRNAHLRSQLSSYAAIMRLRARLETAMAQWFDAKDFVHVRPPIMTASDCEGAGEVFRVTSAESASGLETPDGAESQSSASYLTVSSQLHLEALTLGLGRTYTFTPAFRAEDSATSRHLREFWMCEAEMVTQGDDSDQELQSLMDVVEDVIKAGVAGAGAVGATPSTDGAAAADYAYLLTQSRSHGDEASKSNNVQEAAGIERQVFGPREQARASSSSPWPRITYTKALSLLAAHHSQSGTPFRTAPPPKWGQGLASEHEKWLAEQWARGPVFVTDYPQESKPFYMRVGVDVEDAQGRAIAKCFDLLVPHVGELVGGSLRENNVSVLEERMRNLGLLGQGPPDPDHPLYWYTHSLRTSGLPPHGGFGLGIERLVAWVGKRDSVRDCIPFPRVGRRVRF